jgi:hypothetical protein
MASLSVKPAIETVMNSAARMLGERGKGAIRLC